MKASEAAKAQPRFLDLRRQRTLEQGSVKTMKTKEERILTFLFLDPCFDPLPR